MRPVVICVDPGHGGDDHGTTAGGLIEKDLTLDIANNLVASLIISGIKLVMTRNVDVDLGLDDRAHLAGSYGAHFAMCLHINAHSRATYLRGMEAYYLPADTVGTAIATTVSNRAPPQLITGKLFSAEDKPSDPYDDWLQRPRNVLAPYWRRHIPSVLIECCYASSQRDREFLAGRFAIDAIVCALRAGVVHAAQLIDGQQHKET